MTTAADVIDQVLDRLDEPRTAPVFWSRSELLGYLNDGLVELTLIACHLTSETTYNMISAKLQAVPSGAIALIHAEYAGQPVEKSSIELFDRENPNWDAQSGILRKWAPCGMDAWFLDRHPTAAASVVLTTVDQPVVLAETDVVDLEEEYINGLQDYVFHMARFKEGGAEFEQAMDAYDSFTEKAGMRGQRTFAEQWLVWSRDPNADTGESYSTLDRS